MDFKKAILSMTVMNRVLSSSVRSNFAGPLSMGEEDSTKNVIYLIPSGMSRGGETLARGVYHDMHE